MTTFADLRAYLDALDTLGDVHPIKRPVSPHLEAAAITRRSTEQRFPLPLFQTVEGVEPGFRLAGALGALSSVPGHPFARLALALGLPHTVTSTELVNHLIAGRARPPLPPAVGSSAGAPCKQNILLGADARLDKFPTPLIHQADGAPYLNTWGVVVAKTPDGRWTNWAVSRVMMLDNHHLTGLVLPQQHLGLIWQEWEKIGKPMPYALVQGGDPGVPVVGGMTLPAGADEVAFLGALRGEPVRLVRCETVDLDVPVGAEVVIEGHLSVARDATEGPFAEFHGWALEETSQQPVFSVDAITHRDDPIWPLCAAGRPVDDSHVSPALAISAELVDILRAAGLPINCAWMPLDAACHWTIITVPEDWRSSLPGASTADFVHRIGEVMSQSRAGRLCPVTYVLDDDIDPSNNSDVLWALGTRIHPALRQDSWPGPIMPWYPCYTEEELHSGHGPTVIHDGLLPPVGGGRVPPATFEGVYPPDLRARVLAAEADAP
jgi:4-hydroxy-3-polyprenylbenzoate decarboxylase